MSQSTYLRTNIKITVLLVDDEIKLLDTLSKYLESRRIVVIKAHSSQEALKILNTNKPDVIILDVIMPYATGYELIFSLKNKKDWLSIPFVFLTAKGMTKDRIYGYSLGCRAYITKPFDPEELVTVIKNIVIETKDSNTIKQISNEIRRIRLIIENKNKNNIKFTPREKTILFEIMEGNKNKTIGETLQISTRNVEKYVTRLLNKTNTKNRIELVRFAYRFHKDLRANDENRTRE
jgi:DNA-binding NarL/FixJ family response regulator